MSQVAKRRHFDTTRRTNGKFSIIFNKAKLVTEIPQEGTNTPALVVAAGSVTIDTASCLWARQDAVITSSLGEPLS